MSLKFDQIRPCSAELAALERLKKIFYLPKNYPKICSWHAGSQVSDRCPLDYLFFVFFNMKPWPQHNFYDLMCRRRFREAVQTMYLVP